MEANFQRVIVFLIVLLIIFSIIIIGLLSDILIVLKSRLKRTIIYKDKDPIKDIKKVN